MADRIYLEGVTRPSGLLPCPFCGGEPDYLARASSHTEPGEYHALVCHCGGYSMTAHHGADTQAGVVEQWNGRAAAWVPVDEALPRPGESVLACTRDDVFFGLQLVVRLIEDSDGAHWLLDTGDGTREVWRVTHWLKLPPAPTATT